METRTATITCGFCGKTYEYQDDAVDGVGTVECLPDGYFIPQVGWICDDCGSCRECGRTLEKTPERRGPAGSRLCRYCTGEVKEVYA